MRLALFDFDGTISSKDSFLLFMRYTGGPWKFWSKCLFLSPKILLYMVKYYPNHNLKTDFLNLFFRNWEVEKFKDRATDYCNEIIPTIIRPKALERIKEHQQAGDLAVVVSACPEIILSAWCRDNGLKIIATRLHTENNRITGKLDGLNCWGEEKVKRIKTEVDLEKYSTIFAYGDSSGDRPMLAMADQAFYKPFR